jgi:hypothetical protein
MKHQKSNALFRSVISSFCLMFSFYCSAEQSKTCVSLTQVVEEAQKNNGVVFPIEYEKVRIMVQIKLLPESVLPYANSVYAEDRAQPLFRIFTMKSGCADTQWMMPRDFLVLLGIRQA